MTLGIVFDDEKRFSSIQNSPVDKGFTFGDYLMKLYKEIKRFNQIFILNHDVIYSQRIEECDILIYLIFNHDQCLDTDLEFVRLYAKKSHILTLSFRDNIINVMETRIQNENESIPSRYYSIEIDSSRNFSTRITSLMDDFISRRIKTIYSFNSCFTKLCRSIYINGKNIHLTEMQEHAINTVLEGNNLILNSPRQTGKTLVIGIIKELIDRYSNIQQSKCPGSWEFSKAWYRKSCEININIRISDEEICILFRTIKDKTSFIFISDYEHFIGKNLKMIINKKETKIDLPYIKLKSEDNDFLIILEGVYNRFASYDIKDFVNRTPIINKPLTSVCGKIINDFNFPDYHSIITLEDLENKIRQYQDNKNFVRLFYSVSKKEYYVAHDSFIKIDEFPVLMDEFLLSNELRF